MSEPPSRPATVTVRVGPLDGAGAPHADGESVRVRVPHAVPGDRLRVRETGEGWAEIVEILEPSPDRVPPDCPLSRTCGNCPWMSVSVPAQRRVRDGLLDRWLERDAGVARDAIPERRPLAAGAPLRYRSRARFQVGARGRLVGFHMRHRTRVVDVPACPVLAPALETVYRKLRAALSAEPVEDLTGLELAVAPAGADRGRASLALNPRDRAPRHARGLADRLLESVPRLGGVIWRGGSRGASRLRSAIEIRDAVTIPWLFPVGGFTQVNPEMNARLVEEVLALLQPEPRRILELFAGSGNFSLPLAAAGHEVVAVESDRDAIGACGDSWALALDGAPGDVPRPGGRLDPVEGDAGAVLSELAGGGGFDAVLLDPPRSGFGRLVPGLLRLGAPTLVVVSCRPQTLARDLLPLLEGGYRITRLVPFDFFPHARHLEVALRLDRGGAGE